jgi:hypothetical protein
LNIFKTFLLIPAFSVLGIITTGVFYKLNIPAENMRFAVISFSVSFLYVFYFAINGALNYRTYKEQEHKIKRLQDKLNAMPERKRIKELIEEQKKQFEKYVYNISITDKRILELQNSVETKDIEIKRLKKENKESGTILENLDERMKNGRHYLMGIPVNDITVEDSLEAFGFGRNGLEG